MVFDNREFTADRRTVLQSGLAAGAGSLALGEPVTADEDDEHYVVASDFHWGSPFAEPEKSIQFLEEEVPDIDPDVLVLGGDIYELWWRGMMSTAVEFGRGAAQIGEIHESGTDVALIAGNHDRWTLWIGRDANDEIAPGMPWAVTEEFYFESGGEEFVAVHGDEADDIQRDPLSQWLSRQTDEFGTLLLVLYELVTGIGILGETGSVSVAGDGWQSVSLDHQYDDPVVVPGPLGGDALLKPRVRTETGPVGTDSFELRLDAWDGAAPDGAAVDYLAFERGHHVFGTDTAASVDRVTLDGEWTAVSFGAPLGGAPAVFTVVEEMAASEPPGSGPLRRRGNVARSGVSRDGRDPREGTVRDGVDAIGDPVAVQVRKVTPMGFEARLVAESEPLAHEVGFVAIERGQAGLGDGLVEVGVPGTTDGESLPVEFDTLLSGPDQVLAGPQSATAPDPPLTQLPSQDSDGAAISVVTDDGTPVSETVGYMAAEGVGPIRASSSTAIEEDPDTVLQQEWESLLASGHAIAPDDAPEEAPTSGLLEPLFVGHQSTRETLLDMFEEFVVFGHTHRPDLGERHVNSGSWTNRSSDSVPQNTYVEIVDGDVTVWDWSPEGREQLYPEP